MGLFADEIIEKDSKIAEYNGEILTPEAFAVRYTDKGEKPAYVLQLPGKIIDASDPNSGVARFINRPGAGTKPNARFTQSGNVVSLKKIRRNTEILVSYGAGYRIYSENRPLSAAGLLRSKKAFHEIRSCKNPQKSMLEDLVDSIGPDGSSPSVHPSDFAGLVAASMLLWYESQESQLSAARDADELELDFHPDDEIDGVQEEDDLDDDEKLQNPLPPSKETEKTSESPSASRPTGFKSRAAKSTRKKNKKPELGSESEVEEAENESEDEDDGEAKPKKKKQKSSSAKGKKAAPPRPPASKSRTRRLKVPDPRHFDVGQPREQTKEYIKAREQAQTLRTKGVKTCVSDIDSKAPMLGLFANRDFKAGEVVTFYGGIYAYSDAIPDIPKLRSHTARVAGTDFAQDGYFYSQLFDIGRPVQCFVDGELKEVRAKNAQKYDRFALEMKLPAADRTAVLPVYEEDIPLPEGVDVETLIDTVMDDGLGYMVNAHSSRQNVRIHTIQPLRTGMGVGRPVLIANKDISKNTELLLKYTPK